MYFRPNVGSCQHEANYIYQEEGINVNSGAVGKPHLLPISISGQPSVVSKNTLWQLYSFCMPYTDSRY